MSWRVIDASQLKGKLSYRRGQLMVCPDEREPTAIPLAEIQMVLGGIHCSVSGGLMLKLGELGIPLMFLDWRHIPQSGAFGWSSHTRVGARQIAQAGLSLPKKKSAWSALIRAKVQNQALALRATGSIKEADFLDVLAKKVRSGDPDNIEGQAARFYWRHLELSAGFIREQLSSDPYNSALNYGYTILRGVGIRAVYSAGLWPALGVFHHGRSNAFNLVDDLIEPFRPVVDLVVKNLDLGEDFSGSDIKRTVAHSIKQQFSDDGSAVDTCLNDLSRNFGLYVEGDVSSLSVPKWIGRVTHG
ncbi:type II CRISPR-associated endonuclease Cas1 [Corynebacterium sp. sy039]|uniref:type II CRISPR-associated endonuclease Cas1 n=1 Tax=Corynebacterium sp. sy039 TaxID=2599641 RepID=UPI0011B730D6|nr:type II CRISPR-associated endonuclease Cas1 [Corynebacterium sp. sy039]QDZ41911.1 type II CRISPR-associated endonuclease Cas1 [Corynebacterium sp. sy039]